MGWGNKGGWQSGGGPWGSGPKTPEPPEEPGNDLDDFLRRGQERFRDMFGGGPRGYLLFFLGAGVLWLLSGIYFVQPDEEGVVLRFGAYNRSTLPGARYHLPWPIEQVLKPKVTRVNKIEIGFRSGGATRASSGTGHFIPEESLVLTGDENIVDINFEVQWKIRNAYDFLFKVRDPEATVKQAAESAMREVIGRNRDVILKLAEGRRDIEDAIKVSLQAILDSYAAGIEIVGLQIKKGDPPAAVIEAHLDVQRAETDREKTINQAEAYRNDILPRARGQSERIKQEAKAYKEQVVAKSEGQASRFLAVYNEYLKAKDVTRKRMYLETMEEILEGMDKLVIDSQGKGSGVVPYLPLPELKKRAATTESAQ